MRLVSLQTVRDRARRLANVEGDPNVTDAEMNELVNLHLTEMWDLLINAGPPDYYNLTGTVNVVAGTTSYDIVAAGMTDFMQLTQVMVNETTDILRPIYSVTDKDRAHFRPPQTGGVVTIEYVPNAPTLVADGDTFDGVNGWDQLVSALVARDVLGKRQGDPSLAMAIISAQTVRIRAMASSRDRGSPKQITDIETGYAWPRSVRIDGYRLRAGALEFYESLWGWP